jgi:bifunctional UDP-N-acetylglucosamine pyrophosphorylase/glucosamine-1-phosphate N-acetyltransferase
LVKAGVRDIIVLVNYKASMVKEALGDGLSLGADISYIIQRSTKGTANAVEAGREVLEGEDQFLVVYGDNYYSPKAVERIVEVSRKSSSNLLIGAAKVLDASQFGRLSIKDGLVDGIREKAAQKGPGEVIAGFYLMDQSIFPAITKTKLSSRREFELTDSIQFLIDHDNRFRAVSLHEKEWLGISYPWDLLEANRLALDSMESARDGTVEPGVHIHGMLHLSMGGTIRSGCYLEGPVYVGENASVGPNSYLRPYTVIGAGAHVGAKCEVKNSIIMENAKVPHLSYIGDSIIGAGSSLGAGTITANLRFDDAAIVSMVKGRRVDTGRRKLGAIIGDNVRTGIHVSLLPGVKVGGGAWLGPGAVVARDVPTGARIRR